MHSTLDSQKPFRDNLYDQLETIKSHILSSQRKLQLHKASKFSKVEAQQLIEEISRLNKQKKYIIKEITYFEQLIFPFES